MATGIARGLAAQAWCDPRTSNRVMDPELAEVFAEKLDQYLEALRWCGGSADFGDGGQAREGWLKICDPLLPSDLDDIELLSAVGRLESMGLKQGVDFTIIQEGDPGFPEAG